MTEYDIIQEVKQVLYLDSFNVSKFMDNSTKVVSDIANGSSNKYTKQYAMALLELHE